MSTATSCDTCRNYVYDEDYEYYVCEMDLDEDKMCAFFLTSSVQSCPYYQLDNGYSDCTKTDVRSMKINAVCDIDHTHL